MAANRLQTLAKYAFTLISVTGSIALVAILEQLR